MRVATVSTNAAAVSGRVTGMEEAINRAASSGRWRARSTRSSPVTWPPRAERTIRVTRAASAVVVYWPASRTASISSPQVRRFGWSGAGAGAARGATEVLWELLVPAVLRVVVVLCGLVVAVIVGAPPVSSAGTGSAPGRP